MNTEITADVEDFEAAAEWREQARPWPRFWARILDIHINSFALGLALGYVAPSLFADPIFAERSGELLIGIILLPFALIIDAAFQAFAGNTIGKWLVGIRVETIRHERLTFLSAMHRNFLVYIQGLIIGVPLFILFGYANGYNRLNSGEQTFWDTRLYTRVYNEGSHPARTVLAALLVIASIVAARVWSESLDATMPVPAGPTANAPDPIAVELAQGAAEMNRQGPTMIDEITRLERLSTEGREVTYHYSILRRDGSDEQLVEFINETTVPKVCQDEQMFASMNDYEVIYHYSYMMPSSHSPIAIQVDWEVCNRVLS